MAIQPASRYTIVRSDRQEELASFADEVRRGLAEPPRSIPYRFLYDEAGSELFEEICEAPEYYLTRTESELLAKRADEIAGTFAGPITLAELGSGSSAKTRLLIEGFLHCHGRLRYLPVDISPSMLEQSALQLLERYEGLEVRAIASEYQEGLDHVRADGARAKLIVWLGSSIGNLDRAAAGAFLARVRAAMSPPDRLLVGIDLRKDAATLEAAYDDAAGVTARFSLNLLRRINRELGGGFDLDGFRHEARYLEDEGRVRIQLTSRRAQRVRIADLGIEIAFDAGEGIHIEDAYKYSEQEIAELAEGAGLRLARRWLDPEGLFSLNLLACR